MKKIFITGGGGFIGKNIIEQLNGKYQFLAPTHKELDILNSVAVGEFLEKERPEIILHTANVGGKRNDPNQANTLKNNLLMFFNLCSNKKFFDRLIFLGSGAEYDKSKEIHLIKESQFGEFIPSDEYGLSKFVIANLAKETNYITHLRLFGVFGPHEDYSLRFISNAICKALLDLPITMKQDVLFNYLYVKDLARIIEEVIDRKPSETFMNIGSGQPVKISEIAGRINSLLGKDLPITTALPGFNKEYTCATDRFNEYLPNFKYTDLDSAIKEMIGYYQNILSTLDINKLKYE